MNDKKRNYILNPFHISGKVDGEYLTFDVNPYFYDEDTNFILLIEKETKNLCSAK